MQPIKNEFEMPGESALSRISSFKVMENKGSSAVDEKHAQKKRMEARLRYYGL